KRAYCLKIQPATGSFARNLIYSTKPISITLTRKEFQLLWLLASRAGEIIPRTVIASEIWGINFDSDTNTVDVAIRRLRAKVDDPFPEKLIATIRGMGYSFVAVKK
ncbi:winged helix-turn-helix domain-containing protein, partial [Escherichia coli]|nr:winged helix-turn-helix domain-containing protein [Escherichia coli]